MARKYSERVFRDDWYGKVLVGPGGVVESLPSPHHRMCGTCLGEYDGKRGRFELSLMRDKFVEKIQRLPAEQIGSHPAELCCLCGVEADIEAIFELSDSEVCDGLHKGMRHG